MSDSKETFHKPNWCGHRDCIGPCNTCPLTTGTLDKAGSTGTVKELVAKPSSDQPRSPSHH